MKKISYALFVIFLIIPSYTFASWWNPFTWFKDVEVKKNYNKTEILENRIAELESKLNNVATTTSTSTSEVVTASTTKISASEIKKGVKKTIPEIDNSAIIKAQVKAQVETQLKAKADQDALIAKQKEDDKTKLEYFKISENTQISKQSENMQPSILSVNGKTISGLKFTNANSVYVVPINIISKIDLSFTVIDDKTIYLSSNIFSIIPTGKYQIYVASSNSGISKPFPLEIPFKGIPYKALDGNWYYPNVYDENGKNIQVPSQNIPADRYIKQQENVGFPFSATP